MKKVTSGRQLRVLLKLLWFKRGKRGLQRGKLFNVGRLI